MTLYVINQYLFSFLLFFITIIKKWVFLNHNQKKVLLEALVTLNDVMVKDVYAEIYIFPQ
jgi:hypothetical protein